MKQIFTDYLEQIEDSLKKFLPSETNPEWQNDSFSSLSESVNQNHLKNLIEPCRSLMDSGGKRWRPLLLILCSQMARESGKKGLSLEETFGLTPLVEFVHTASLIHDDIEDGADTRRGKPAAHITYGLDTSINAASWLYFEAGICINSLKTDENFKNRLYRLYTQELRRLHLGQAMDIYWHRNPSLIPSVEEYFQMVQCKTGTLASLAVQTGITAGGGSAQEAEKAGKIAAFLGQGFQILDDVQNLTTGNPGKKRGDDIVEGKKSLPVLLHIQKAPEDMEKIASLMEKARKEGIDSPAVEECIKILETKGAVEEARDQGIKYIEENSRNLGLLFGNKTESSVLINELFDSMASKFINTQQEK